MKLVCIILGLVVLAGCTGSSVIKARRVSIFDEYFILGKKKYKVYIAALARISSEKGRYTVSGDSIYLLKKKTGNLYTLNGYAFADTATSTLMYQGLDSNYTKIFKLELYKPYW